LKTELSGPVPTMLYVPGADERKLAKISELDAPAFILDLEDAVAISQKSRARAAISHVLEFGLRIPTWVRVNLQLPDMLYDDLHAVVRPGLDGLVLPKVERQTDVERVDWLVGVLEDRAGMERGSVGLLATIESARGLATVDGIATSSPRLRWLGFGAGDFTLDLGLEWPTPDGGLGGTVLAAKSEIVLASRRAGLEAPHDGSFPRYRDHEGLRSEALQAKALGFGAKHAIHPDQVPVIRKVFWPSDAEIDRAREILAHFDQQESRGVANVGHVDQLVDYPVAERARRLLHFAATGHVAGTDRDKVPDSKARP